MPTLSVSLVTYNPDPVVVGDTAGSLARAASAARAAGELESASLTLVDNGPGEAARRFVEALAHELASEPGLATRVLSGHGNVGYGRGHNLALAGSTADYHLVLNPDVVMADTALAEAVRFMERHPEAGVLSPHVAGEDGAIQYLCKRRPTALALALRAFAPHWLKRPFRGYLDRYEMRDAIGERVVPDVPIVSGAFMFFRRELLQRLGGFDPAYFLYFEDFDLSLRAGREAKLAYVPQVRVVHRGGDAARKGSHHIRLFVRSGVTFFNRHGWRWV